MNVADVYRESRKYSVIYAMDDAGNCVMIFNGTHAQCRDVARRYARDYIFKFHKESMK